MLRKSRACIIMAARWRRFFKASSGRTFCDSQDLKDLIAKSDFLMRPFGFSTGALAKANFHAGLDLQRGLGVERQSSFPPYGVKSFSL